MKITVTDCNNCPFNYRISCQLNNDKPIDNIPFPKWCPLIEQSVIVELVV